MLLNFCDHRLRPEVHCSTVHTEGYEVTNLINDSSKGFLAYSCIRPPVNIDFTFVCNVRIHYVLIWPCVGSQKSSGFQLYAKTTNDHATPYTLLSSGSLGSTDIGLLFHSTRVDAKSIPSPANFLKRYIPASKDHLIAYTQSLRLCIWKTENSVPALGKIEVWGTVSPHCGKDVMASVCALWTAINEPSILPLSSEVTPQNTDTSQETCSRNEARVSLEIPESFLDAITFEIMTQPIILPSGKIIDQRTLEKHEANEAIWGRTPSDPFTGLPLTEERRPVIATSLKTQIDKFLLENSNADEVKRIPRVLGCAIPSSKMLHSEIIGQPSSSTNECMLNTIMSISGSETCSSVAENSAKAKNHQLKESSLVKRIGHCHRLPIIAISNPQSANVVRPIKRKKTLTSFVPISALEDESDNTSNERCNNNVTNVDVEHNLNSAVQDVLSSLKCFDSPKKNDVHHTQLTCSCCSNNVLYRLPCAHVVCRKILMTRENSKCQTCGKSWKPSEVKRIHE